MPAMLLREAQLDPVGHRRVLANRPTHQQNRAELQILFVGQLTCRQGSVEPRLTNYDVLNLCPKELLVHRIALTKIE